MQARETRPLARPRQLDAGDRLAFTGPTYHLPDCARAARSGRITWAVRAVKDRVPCPLCLPYGAEVKAL